MWDTTWRCICSTDQSSTWVMSVSRVFMNACASSRWMEPVLATALVNGATGWWYSTSLHFYALLCTTKKMVNGTRFYRALESVSIASALSSALTIYRSESINADSLKLQLLTARKKEWWPATADSLPRAVTCQTVKHTALAGIELATFRLPVRRATSSATETTEVTKFGWFPWKQAVDEDLKSLHL